MVKKVVILTVFILAGMTASFCLPSPKEWGLTVTGVKTRLSTKKRVVALTFDACGGPRGSSYDEKLINFLKKEKIKATLFFNSRWIDKNRAVFIRLASDPLFEIENHGQNHRPCSVNGRSAYGIAGTKSPAEAEKEIRLGGEKIEQLTGRKPLFYRSGTAHYDEIAAVIANRLGYQTVNFNVNGDLGATASAAYIYQQLISAHPGSIIIMHMNQPRGETAEGLISAIPILRKKGYSFVLLRDQLLE